jgi:hypothetical protein
MKKLLMLVTLAQVFSVSAYKAQLYNDTPYEIQFALYTSLLGCYAGELSGDEPYRTKVSPGQGRLFYENDNNPSGELLEYRCMEPAGLA